MKTECPSCHQAFDQNETMSRLEDGASTVRCANCGADLSHNEMTNTWVMTATPELKSVGKFTMLRLLGEGGFGAVWLAEDQNLGRRVAVKLPKSTRDDPTLVREAQTAAQLRHPNIVTVYEVGVEDGQVFIASEFIDGSDLRTEIETGRPEIERVVYLVTTLARAVQHAHEHDIVHRDIKPANIIINAEGEPFITDFGIAKQLSVDETISTDGAVIGTVSYMSPEQARGETRLTDHRSDVYSLGVILFELLTEYRPFRGNARAVLDQKINEEPPSPRKLVPAVPKDLATICSKCIERESGQRYQSAAALAEDLERFANAEPIRARPISRIEKAWRWCRRKPVVATLLAGLVLSITLGVAGVSYFGWEARRSADATAEALYLARMNLAARLWENGDVGGVRSILSHYDNADTGERDFEWQYFDRLTEPIVQVVNHGDVVTDVAVSRDGRLMASTGTDRTIRVYDAESGDLVRTLSPPARVGTLAFLPNDDRLLSAHADGVARLWNPVQHGRVIREFEHGPGLTVVRVSPNGNLVATGGRTGRVRLFALGSGEELIAPPEDTLAIRDLRFDSSGRRLAVAAQAGAVTVLDTKTGERLHKLESRTTLQCLAFTSDDSALVAGTYGGALHYFSLELGERTAVPVAGGAVGDVEYLTETGLLAVVTTGHYLSLIDRDHRVVRSLATHTLSHGVLAQSGDGRLLAVGSGDGSVKLLNVPTLARQDVFWHDTHCRAVQFVDDSHVVTCAGDGEVRLWDLENSESRTLVQADGREMLAVAVAPARDRLAVCGMSRELTLIDMPQEAVAATIPLPYAGFGAVCFSPKGDTVAVGSRSGSVRVYSVGDRAQKFEVLEPDVRINAIAFTPDGDQLVIACSDARVLFADASNGTVEQKHVKLDANPLSLTFCSHDLLAVGTQSGAIHLVECSSRERVKLLKGHSSRVNALAQVPGGTRLVSGGRDRQLVLWDLHSGEVASTLAGHDRQVFGISVSPNGRTIASVGLSGDLRIWRASD